MESLDSGALEQERARNREATEMRQGLPGMVQFFARRQIIRCVSATYHARPHRFAEEVSAWWLGEISQPTRHGDMHVVVLATQSGALYTEYDDVNWRGHVVRRCRRPASGDPITTRSKRVSSFCWRTSSAAEVAATLRQALIPRHP